jgi:hypothetical protein
MDRSSAWNGVDVYVRNGAPMAGSTTGQVLPSIMDQTVALLTNSDATSVECSQIASRTTLPYCYNVKFSLNSRF